MADRYTELFRFVSLELDPETFHVIRFSGTEGLNRLFSFEIDLVSTNVAVDAEALLHNRAVLTIQRADGSTATFSGYPSEFRQSGHFNGYTYYSVTLRPTFWKTRFIVQSQIFLDQTVQDTVTALLNQQTYFTFAREFQLAGSYPKQEFAMQHNESVYDYICWRLEQQGISWFTRQDGMVDTLVFTDSVATRATLPATTSLRYSPQSGMQAAHLEEVILSFALTCGQTPRRVVVRSYSWKDPNKPIVGVADVSKTGIGDVYLTREPVETEAEAQRIAKIRAEELLCRSRIFTGTSAVPSLRPGFLFTLTDHYSPAFNREYFLTDVTHEGSQEAFLSLGLGIPMHNVKDHYFYHNTFSCIESDAVYRPARISPRASVQGVIHAFIDGAGSGTRPELDAYGRYKVLFPFDVSDNAPGNASCWVRMAQPQVGNRSGMSFPLLPGTEVAVAFIDGNPDAPLISGAIPNGETGALTGNGNNQFSGMRSAGGNQIVFHDTNKSQGISLGTPSGNGLAMTAGSTSVLEAKTDISLNAYSMAGSEIATFSKCLTTGYKAAQKAGSPGILALIQKFITMSSGIASDFLDAEGKKTNKLTWKNAARDTKLSAVIINSLIDMGDELGGGVKNVTKDKEKLKTMYGYTLSSSSGSASSVAQVPPNIGMLVAGQVLSIAGKSLSVGMQSKAASKKEENSKEDYIAILEKAINTLNDHKAEYKNKYTESLIAGLSSEAKNTLCSKKDMVAGDLFRENVLLTIDIQNALAADPNADVSDKQKKKAEFAGLKFKLEDAWATYCDDSSTNESYYAQKKHEATLDVTTSALSDLLPEIIAFIMLFLGPKKYNEKDYGGILLNTKDSNINMLASGPISINSPECVYLNTENISPKMEGKVDFDTSGSKATLKQWGLPKEPKKRKPIDDIRKNNFSNNFMKKTGSIDDPDMKKLSGKENFVAVDTNSLYEGAQWRKHVTWLTNKSIARKHILQSLEGKHALKISQDLDAFFKRPAVIALDTTLSAQYTALDVAKKGKEEIENAQQNASAADIVLKEALKLVLEKGIVELKSQIKETQDKFVKELEKFVKAEESGFISLESQDKISLQQVQLEQSKPTGVLETFAAGKYQLEIQKKGEIKQQILAEPDKLTFQTAEGKGKAPKILLEPEALTLQGSESVMTFKDGKITLAAKNKEVLIGDVTVNNGKINGNGVIEINGAVKVMK